MDQDLTARTPTAGEAFTRSAVEGLYGPTSRVHLLYLIVESAVRGETNYSRAVADLWSRNLRWIGSAAGPLASVAQRLASADGLFAISYVDRTSRYVSARMKQAAAQVSNIGTVASSGFYEALRSVRQARLALAVLIERMGHPPEPLESLANWERADLIDVDLSGDKLHADLNALTLAGERDDDVCQCRASRQAMLSLYWAATFDGGLAANFEEPVLSAHRDLVRLMPPSVLRECVQQRLELLRSIPPAQFSDHALRVAAALAREESAAPL